MLQQTPIFPGKRNHNLYVLGGLSMNAHLVADSDVADSDIVDKGDIGLLSATKQPNLVRDYYGQAAVRRNTQRARPDGIGELSSPWVNSIARRCLDSLIAAIALLVSLPVMLLIIPLVRLSSTGPIFFRQLRAGRHRNEFTVYKFRSMRVENRPGPLITVSGDPRITALGGFLRRYKLDELPQFWNVLIGKMSLVGPRPKLPHHEGLDLPYRPGITGMASLAFRNEEKILSTIPRDQLDAFYDNHIKPTKARLDSEYMRSATLWTDLTVLGLTAFSCFCDLDNSSGGEDGCLTQFSAAWSDPASDLSGRSSGT